MSSKFVEPTPTQHQSDDIVDLDAFDELDTHYTHTNEIKFELSLYDAVVKDQYNNVKEYVATYKNLLNLEEDETEKKIMAQKFDNIEVNRLGQTTASFRLPDATVALRSGEMFLIKKETKSIEAIITTAPKDVNDDIIVMFRNEWPFERSECLFNIELKHDETTYSRCVAALNGFEELFQNDINNIYSKHESNETFDNKNWDLSRDVRRIILGEQINCKNSLCFNMNNVKELNPSQKTAVENALRHHVSLIQGPPGTGKTSTASSIIDVMHRMNLKCLVAAPSNTATDNLLEKICKKFPKDVVRVCSTSNEYRMSDLKEFCLHHLIHTDEYLNKCQGKQAFLSLYAKLPLLAESERLQYRKIKNHLENMVLQSKTIVFATCAGCGDKRLKKYFFDVILIDECTQDTEPTCLIPIMRGNSSAKIVLVGDNQQLGPVVTSFEAVSGKFETSMFQRLVNAKNVPFCMLNVQFRMHSNLAFMSNNLFYNGNLKNGLNDECRKDPRLTGFWPANNTPTRFIHVSSPELSDNNSICNQGEVITIVKILENLNMRGIKSDEIAVLTSYTAQIRLLRKKFELQCEENNDSYYRNVDIASINGFQGREKNYIIFSLVRSNESGRIGFIEDKRRLNVAITRAKYGLIIVGNIETFRSAEKWRLLVAEYIKAGLVHDGFSTVPYKTNVDQNKYVEDFLQMNPIKCNNKDSSLNSFQHLGKFSLDKRCTQDRCVLYIHHEFVGCIYGPGGKTLKKLCRDFNCDIYCEKLSSTQFKCITITSNCQSARAAVCSLNKIVYDEIAAREAFDWRFKTETKECNLYHPIPTALTIDDAFQIVQMRDSFIEFRVRHDIAGALIGRGAFFRHQINENHNCDIVLGARGEFRTGKIYPQGPVQNLVDVATYVKNYLCTKFK